MKTIFCLLLGMLAFATASAAPGIISLSPTRLVLSAGQSTTLSVIASGSMTLSHQWSRNGRAIAGATGSSYLLPSITAQDDGYYFVDVTDIDGTTRSAPIFLTVAPAVTEVIAWGSNSHLQTVIPAGLTDAIAISGGAQHAVALKRDGTVVAWGRNDEGETNVPSGLTGVVKVASGASSNHTLAIKADGTVVAWGWNPSGQTDVPLGLQDVVAVAAGTNHSLALRSDGTVIAWGGNYSGQTTIPSGLSGVVAISVGNDHSFALKSDGTVVAWGLNNFSQTDVPVGLSGVVAIAAGGWNSLALKSNGTVVQWGFSYAFYGGVPSDLPDVGQIAQADSHSIALKNNGTVVGWGDNSVGQTAVPSDLTDVLAISCGSVFSLALRNATVDIAPAITTQPSTQSRTAGNSATFIGAASGTPVPTYQWKKNGTAIAGATGTSYTIAAIEAGDAGSYTFVATNYLGSATSNAAILTVNPLPVVTAVSSARNIVIPGQSVDLSVTAAGTGTLSYQWYHSGRLISGATGAGYTPGNLSIGDSGAYWVAVTDNYGTSRKVFFVTVAPQKMKVVAWGDNTNGQLNVPAGLNDLIGISINGSTSLGLKRNGTIVAWGPDDWGLKNVPVGLANVVAVSASPFFGVALKSDGTVTAWGHNSVGQTDVPAGLIDVVSVAAGQNHALALKSDGTVVAWGYNYNGQATVPGGLSNVVFIAAQNDFSFAVKDDGTLVHWGYPGSAGDVPVGLTSVSAVSVDYFHGLALKNDGTVSAWGWQSAASEAALAGRSGFIAVVSPGRLALKSDGSIFAWGQASDGFATIPADLASVFAVVSASSWGFALRDIYPAPDFTIQPVNQAVLPGGSVAFTAAANGSPAPTLQWQRLPVGSGAWADVSEGGIYSGTTTTTLTVSNITGGMTGDQFRCVATNSAGSATSDAAAVGIIIAPGNAVITFTIE